MGGLFRKGTRFQVAKSKEEYFAPKDGPLGVLGLLFACLRPRQAPAANSKKAKEPKCKRQHGSQASTAAGALPSHADADVEHTAVSRASSLASRAATKTSVASSVQLESVGGQNSDGEYITAPLESMPHTSSHCGSQQRTSAGASAAMRTGGHLVSPPGPTDALQEFYNSLADRSSLSNRRSSQVSMRDVVLSRNMTPSSSIKVQPAPDTPRSVMRALPPAAVAAARSVSNLGASPRTQQQMQQPDGRSSRGSRVELLAEAQPLGHTQSLPVQGGDRHIADEWLQAQRTQALADATAGPNTPPGGFPRRSVREALGLQEIGSPDGRPPTEALLPAPRSLRNSPLLMARPPQSPMSRQASHGGGWRAAVAAATANAAANAGVQPSPDPSWSRASRPPSNGARERTSAGQAFVGGGSPAGQRERTSGGQAFSAAPSSAGQGERGTALDYLPLPAARDRASGGQSFVHAGQSGGPRERPTPLEYVPSPSMRKRSSCGQVSVPALQPAGSRERPTPLEYVPSPSLRERTSANAVAMSTPQPPALRERAASYAASPPGQRERTSSQNISQPVRSPFIRRIRESLDEPMRASAFSDAGIAPSNDGLHHQPLRADSVGPQGLQSRLLPASASGVSLAFSQGGGNDNGSAGSPTVRQFAKWNSAKVADAGMAPVAESPQHRLGGATARPTERTSGQRVVPAWPGLKVHCEQP